MMPQTGKHSRSAAARGSAGFTLPEVLIAAALLTIWFASLAQVTTMVTSMNELGIQMSEAELLAQSRMDEIQLTPYSSIAAGSSTSTPYTVTWTVTEITSPRHKDISLSVSWRDIRGKNHSIDRRTIARRL